MVVCPPIWIFFSLPLNIKMNKVPYVKFICRTVSHFFLLLLLVLTGKVCKLVMLRPLSCIVCSACIPIDDIQSRNVYIPKWYEWLLLSKKLNIILKRFYHIFLSSLGIRIAFNWANDRWRKNWSWNAKVCIYLSLKIRYLFHPFRPLIVFFGAVAVGLHLALFLIPPDYSNTFLYVR